MRRHSRPYASQYDYFARLDAAFAAAEAAYDDAAWEALSERQQLDALGMSDRRIKHPCEAMPPQEINAHRRRVGLRHEAILLAAIAADPTATAAELAQRLELTKPTVEMTRKRLLHAGRIRGERLGFTEWRYEVLV